MEILITFLQIFGVIVLVFIAVGFAAHSKLQGRAARQANKAARLGVEAPAENEETANRDS